VATVQAYLAAPGTEKLPLVRLPNRVRPLMEKWYTRHPDVTATAGEVVNRVKMDIGGAYLLGLEMPVTFPDPLNPGATRTENRFFAVEEIGKDDAKTYRVDWETAVGWGEMTPDEFKVARPRNPVAFRFRIRASDYYNHGFNDQKKWLATELYLPRPGDHRDRVFYGYLERGSQVFRELEACVEPGQSAALIVAIKYPEQVDSLEQVIIDSVLRKSWFYREDKP
jgi:hypothetical protein